MSGTVFDIGMTLRARELGRAIPVSERKHSVIHEEAVGITALAMAGERTGLWGIGFGKIRRGQAHYAAVGDARDHDEQARLWREMNGVLSTAGDEPQIVVSNRQTKRLLAESAARFRYHPDPEVAHAAELVWWACERHDVAGSHALVVLSELLAEHYAMGADGGPCDDLRTWLGWLEATGSADLVDKVTAREAEPPDPKTTLQFDEALWPKVERRKEDRDARQVLVSASATDAERKKAERDVKLQARNRAATVKVALTPLLRASWERIIRTAGIFAKDRRAHLVYLEEFCSADEASWARELRRRERGYSQSRRQNPRQAILSYAEAEIAQSCWWGALVWDDSVARSRALADGEALRGTVTASDSGGFTLTAQGDSVRTRIGDSMSLMGPEGPVEVSVTDMSDDAGAVSVTFEWDDSRIPQSVGAEVTVWPPPPDFGRRYLGWLSGKLMEKHWALGDVAVPATASASFDDGSDPLALVEALRV